jgi:hypothetical protein
VTSVGVLEAEIAPGILRVDVADKANYENGKCPLPANHSSLGRGSVSGAWPFSCLTT